MGGIQLHALDFRDVIRGDIPKRKHSRISKKL